MKRKNNILLFGAFDGLHKGHIALISEAKKRANTVTVALALDESIVSLKGKSPKFNFDTRKQALEELNDVHRVIPGDKEEGIYETVLFSDPDAIGLGYDQDALENDLKRWLALHKKSIELHKFNSFQPETYKSSLLNYD